MPTDLRAHAEAVLKAAFPNMNAAIIAVAAKQPGVLTALAALHDEAARAMQEAAAEVLNCRYGFPTHGHEPGFTDVQRIRAIDPASLREGV